MDSGRHDGRIVALPDRISAKINSSNHITSLEQVIIGLLENSLDAKANKIEVTVDFAKGACMIDDNGCGIAAFNFDVDGGLCKSNHTSKLDSRDTHSANGNFLAALSVLSLLSIRSKTSHEQFVSSLTMHQDKVISRRVLDSDIQLPSHGNGTSITVKDIFGNMPVRVKQRALKHDSVRVSARAWQNLKHEIVATILAWDYPCSVRARCLAFPNDTLKLNTLQSSTSNELTSRTLEKLLTKSTIVSLRSRLVLLSQAGLTATRDRDQWIPLASSNRRFEIRGVVSTEAAPSKACQFISIGYSRVEKHSSNNVLYDTVNQLFDQSKFALAPNDGEAESGGLKASHAARTVDRWPMFVLQIRFKEATMVVGGSVSTEVMLSKISKLLVVTIRQWLKEHDLLSSNIDRGKNDSRVASRSNSRRSLSRVRYEKTLQNSGETTIDASVINIGDHFENNPPWSTLRQSKTRPPRLARSATEPVEETTKYNLAAAQGKCNPTNMDEHSCCSSSDAYGYLSSGALAEMNELASGVDTNDHDAARSSMKWRDPKTSKWYDIDFRTGHATLCKQDSADPGQVNSSKHNLKLTHRAASAPLDPAVLPDSLRTWQPPFFQAPVEQRIQRTESAQDFAAQRLHERLPFKVLPPLLDAESLSRHGLRDAEVIGQVDAKYILCRMPGKEEGSNNDKLAIIDQHAASERIILEQLFSKLCQEADYVCLQAYPGARFDTQSFRNPLRFEISSDEYRLFTTHAMYFASWSIFFDLEVHNESASLTNKKSGSDHRLMVKAVPPVIYERCRSNPSVMIQLMRQTIWQLADDHVYQALQTKQKIGDLNKAKDQTQHWINYLATCPQSLIDLLNSRACRSAIMFNDVLSLDDCNNLVNQLSKTAFPFICAHGRVSIVPILQLQNDHQDTNLTASLHTTSNIMKSDNFMEQYKHWRSH